MEGGVLENTGMHEQMHLVLYPRDEILSRFTKYIFIYIEGKRIFLVIFAIE